MMDAMSCGAVVLGSATSPVKEMIRDGENGLLADFFSPEEIASKAVKVLQNPGEYRPLGRAAEQMITERYSLEAVLPAMLQMYDEAIGSRPRQIAPAPIAQPSVQSGLPRLSQEVISISRPRGMKSSSPFRG